MSEVGAEEIRGVAWPSNGLTEVPFRLHTDPEQYRLEQERVFKGPAWSFLCSPPCYAPARRPRLGRSAVIAAVSQRIRSAG